MYTCNIFLICLSITYVTRHTILKVYRVEQRIISIEKNTSNSIELFCVQFAAVYIVWGSIL